MKSLKFNPFYSGLLPLVSVSVLTIVLMFFLMDRFLSQQQQQISKIQQLDLLNMIKFNLKNLYNSYEHPVNFKHRFQDIIVFDDIVSIDIVAPNFQVLHSNNPANEGTLFEMPLEFAGSKLDTMLHLWSNDQNQVMAIVPILNTRNCVACHQGGELIAYSVVRAHNTPFESHIKRDLYILVGTSSLIAIVLLLTAFGIHFRYVRRSFNKINKGIQEYEKGNFDFSIEMKTPSELGDLAMSINNLGRHLKKMRQQILQDHEVELEKADKMATVGELAASIAHEIKNPVAGISNAMQVLKSELPEGDERRMIFDEILRQTTRVNTAVNDLLTYARPVRPEFVVGDLNKPTKRALLLMEGQRKEAKVDLEMELDESPPTVLLDPLHIQQVIVNLTLNAIQAMQKGGKLKVKTSHNDNYTYVIVQDNGVGIPKDKLNEIFKPFYTSKHKGTGLGLSISRSIIENHKGTIFVESELNFGSTFTIQIPIYPMKEGLDT